MFDLKTYDYTEIEAILGELISGRVPELRHERFMVLTEASKRRTMEVGRYEN